MSRGKCGGVGGEREGQGDRVKGGRGKKKVARRSVHRGCYYTTAAYVKKEAQSTANGLSGGGSHWPWRAPRSPGGFGVRPL